jgi:hypothetical protein
MPDADQQTILVVGSALIVALAVILAVRETLRWKLHRAGGSWHGLLTSVFLLLIALGNGATALYQLNHDSGGVFLGASFVRGALFTLMVYLLARHPKQMPGAANPRGPGSASPVSEDQHMQSSKP